MILFHKFSFRMFEMSIREKMGHHVGKPGREAWATVQSVVVTFAS